MSRANKIRQAEREGIVAALRDRLAHYPTDVFPTVSATQRDAAAKAVAEVGISLDRLSAHIYRHAYEQAIYDVKQEES